MPAALSTAWPARKYDLFSAWASAALMYATLACSYDLAARKAVAAAAAPYATPKRPGGQRRAGGRLARIRCLHAPALLYSMAAVSKSGFHLNKVLVTLPRPRTTGAARIAS